MKRIKTLYKPNKLDVLLLVVAVLGYFSQWQKTTAIGYWLSIIVPLLGIICGLAVVLRIALFRKFNTIDWTVVFLLVTFFCAAIYSYVSNR